MPEEKFRKVLRSFAKGLITRVDDRDAPEDSLAACNGFIVPDKVGLLRKDFGYTKYNSWTLPPALTRVIDFATFRIEDDLQYDFVVLFGTKSDNLPRFWIRKFWNKAVSSSLVDAWTELTEKEGSESADTITISTAYLSSGTPNIFDLSSGLTQQSNDYYNGWIVYNQTRGDFGTVTDYVSASRKITIDEYRDLWVATDRIVLYRFLETKNFRMDTIPVGTSQFFRANNLKSQLAIGWQRNDPDREHSLLVKRLRSSFFYSGSDFFIKDKDTFHFGREVPEYESLADLGITFSDTAVHNSVTYPTATPSDTGDWTVTGAASIHAALNDYSSSVVRNVPNDATYISVSKNFTSPISAFRVTMNTYSAPTNGYANVRVRMSGRFIGRSSGGNISKIIIRLYASFSGSSAIYTLGYKAIDNPAIDGNIQDFYLPVQIEAGKWKDINRNISDTTDIFVNVDSQVIDRGYVGVGTITTSGTAVTFNSGSIQVSPGDRITSGGQTRTVSYLTAPAGCVVDAAFSPDLTTQAFNVNAGSVNFLFSMVGIDFQSTSNVSTLMRCVAVPMFDGYLIGKPLPFNSYVDNTVKRYYLQPRIVWSKSNQRLTHIFVFTDDAVATRTNNDFVSAYKFCLTESGANDHVAPWETVRIWRDKTGAIGTGTISVNGDPTPSAAVTGSGTYFVSEVMVGDKLLFQNEAGTWIVRTVTTVTDDTNIVLNATVDSDVTANAFYIFNPEGYYLAQECATIDGSGNPSDYAKPFQINISRESTLLQTLQDFLNYSVDDAIPAIDPLWRFQVQASLRQEAQVVTDESDDVLRMSLYDGDEIHNDHVFPQTSRDSADNPLMLFLSTKGKLLNILSQLGKLYVFKENSIEEIDPLTTRPNVYISDVYAPKSIIATSLGIMFAGKNSISVLPIHNGIREEISDSIRDDYLSLSDTWKQAIVAMEIKRHNIVMFSVQTGSTSYKQYCYHLGMGIWWTRTLANAPKSMWKLNEGTVLILTQGATVVTTLSGTASSSGVTVTFSDSQSISVGDTIIADGEDRRIATVVSGTVYTIESQFTSPLSSDTVQLVSGNYAKIIEYPDDATYFDDGYGVEWEIETQWMNNGLGLANTLHRIMSIATTSGANNSYQIKIYFDRSTAAQFDIVYPTLYQVPTTAGVEDLLPVLKPNQFKEFKLKIQKKSTNTYRDYGQMELSELRLTGEQFNVGNES